VSLSTWNSYRAEAQIPQPVSIALRAALRDPLLLQAHLRPRKPDDRGKRPDSVAVSVRP